MKVRIDTYGQMFSLFVETPIRTPAVIEITQKQLEVLQRLAQVNGWKVDVIQEPKTTKKTTSKTTTNTTDTSTDEN